MINAVWHGEPYRDFSLKKWLVTFECDELPDYDGTRGKALDLEIKVHREKRSLSANAYFHVLVGKIADVLKVTHTEVHNKLISEYGYVDVDLPTVIIDDSIPYLKVETMHLRPTTATKVLDNGKLYRVYLVMRGSHTYDTQEMSRLIDGTVSEAKELGIETLSPVEIERMKKLWRAS